MGLDEDYEYPTYFMLEGCGELKKVDLSGFSSFAGNELNSDSYLEEVVFPDKLTTVTLNENTPLQGTFYFPDTLKTISFGGYLGDKDLTVYGPLAIKTSVDALNETKKGTGKATFIEMNSSSQNYPYTEKIYAEGISLDITEHTLKFNIDQGKGGSVTITAQITPSSVSNQKVRWSSDSSHVVVKYNPSEKKARVTATGLDGDARITATSGDGRKSATCLIHVEKSSDEPGPEEVSVTGVTLDPKFAEVAVNNTIKLKASVKPDNATNKKVTWSSSDNSIATVDQEGNVTGKKKGFTTITVTTEDGGKKADCIVTVINVPLVKIALPVSANVEKGKTTKLEVTFTPSNASNKNLTWTVSDTNIATVANGTVTGVSAGSTVVTAKSEDGDHTASCTVTVTEPAPEPTPTPTPVPGVTTYTVVFKDGDTVVDTQLVQDGQPAKIPALTPAKEGFSFLGWANGNKLWDFNQPVRFNLTLIAKYVSTSPEAVSKNSGSGSDPVPEIQNDTIYLVKGQTYTAGGSGWSLSEGTGTAKVAAKTGKIFAQKKGKAVVTNGTLKYTVIVAEPAFESSAKKIPLLVGTTESVKDKFKINSFDSDSDSKYPITWSSANPRIAIVNDGVITGVAKGNVNIYACVGGKQYTSKVTVTDTYKAPAKQTERTISFNMNPLQTITLKYDTNVFKVKGAVWSGDGLEATSNNKGKPDGGFKNDKISITKAGKIKAIGKGSTTITGKDAQNREVQVTITVHAVSSKENTYITKGKRETVKFAFVKNSKAAWDSSDKSIISDFKNGSIKGASVGSSKISCTYEGFEFNTLAYVEDPEFNTDNKLVKNGTKYTMTLNAGELYNRVTLKNVYQTVNFKSSKPAVAFIDENGVIYARNAGKTNITTSINGKTIKISLIVK
ncbi:MAG: Ig-like domain-containing protein [Lachnospiraceae bacterium]|nr:Ig-like domain-containing protein [Lachnospiraceae bacterium]